MAAALPAFAYRLRVVVARILQRLRVAEGAAGPGVSWSQQAILVRIESEGETTAAALAAAEGVRPQSMGAQIDHLEAEGLVGRRPDPHDRRQQRVFLTDKGMALIKAQRASKEQWLAQVISERLTRDELTTLRAAVEILEKLVE